MMLSCYLCLALRLRMWPCGINLREWSTKFYCLAWIT
jgi:hypothetical protein